MNNLSAQLENQIDELKKLQQAVIAYEQAQRQQLYAGNRLFQDPSQVRFTTVFLVAQTLGVSLCAI